MPTKAIALCLAFGLATIPLPAKAGRLGWAVAGGMSSTWLYTSPVLESKPGGVVGGAAFGMVSYRISSGFRAGLSIGNLLSGARWGKQENRPREVTVDLSSVAGTARLEYWPSSRGRPRWFYASAGFDVVRLQSADLTWSADNFGTIEGGAHGIEGLLSRTRLGAMIGIGIAHPRVRPLFAELQGHFGISDFYTADNEAGWLERIHVQNWAVDGLSWREQSVVLLGGVRF